MYSTRTTLHSITVQSIVCPVVTTQNPFHQISPVDVLIFLRPLSLLQHSARQPFEHKRVQALCPGCRQRASNVILAI